MPAFRLRSPRYAPGGLLARIEAVKETPEKAIISIAHALANGETAKGEIVLLIIQVFVHQSESLTFVVVCPRVFHFSVPIKCQ